MSLDTEPGYMLVGEPGGITATLRGSTFDPCQAVYDALEQQGWDPQGPPYKARANCPAHGGDSHQLRLNEGSDGRALLYCHTNRCSAGEIVRVLGLQWADLFPPGHDQARSATLDGPPQPKRRVEKLAELLALLDEAGESWQVMVMCRCAFCGEPGAMIDTTMPVAAQSYENLDGERVVIQGHKGGDLKASCAHGCSDRAFRQGLMGRVQLARAERAA